jgi:hypothetical protein
VTLQRGGDPERSRTLLLEAAAVARECGDMFALMAVAHGLGAIALETGDAETARKQFRRELELARELSNARSEAIALVSLSRVALVERDAEDAGPGLNSALRLASALGERALIWECLVGSAEAATQHGEMTRAARLFGAADALREEIGYFPEPSAREQHLRVATALGNDAALVEARSEGRVLTLDDAVAYALGEDA